MKITKLNTLSSALMAASLMSPLTAGAMALTGTGTSTTVLTTNVSTAAYGTPVNATVDIVECASPCPAAAFGFVKIYDSTTLVATVPVDGTGLSSTIAINGLLPGSHSLIAKYSGDAYNAASQSATKSVTITGTTTATSPGVMTWTKSYNVASQQTSAIDPIANVSSTTYNALYFPLVVTGPTDLGKTVPQSVTYTYDTATNVASAKDARNTTTSMVSNSLGGVKSIVSPDAGTSSRVFDAAGRLTSATDARGKVTSVTYDAIGRVKTVSYTTGVGSIYTYDAGGGGNIGKLTGVTDESGSSSFAYDSAGRLVTQTNVINGKSFVTSYVWGDSSVNTDQLTSIVLPSGNKITYGFGTDASLASVSLYAVNPNGVGQSTTATSLVSGITYKGPGMVAGLNRINSASTDAFTYDTYGMIATYPLGMASGTSTAAGSTRTLTRDAMERITAYTHKNGSTSVPSLDQTFVLNNTGKLKSATIGGVTTSYGYDDGDNRTTKVVGATTYTNVIAATSNRETSFQDVGGTVTPTYDSAGNVLTDGTYTYTYSDRGRMSSSTTAGVTTTYKYDSTDHRVSAISPSGTVYYVYGPGGLAGEYDANGAPLSEHVYIGSTPVAVLKQSGTAAGNNIAITPYNVYADHLGTPRIVTNAAGAIVWRWDTIEAYGGGVPNENPNALGVFSYNLRFPGQVYDAKTGLYQNQRREYNPRLGRYMQSDPIGLAGGMNTFEYVNGSPTMFSDPTGEETPQQLERVEVTRKKPEKSIRWWYEDLTQMIEAWQPIEKGGEGGGGKGSGSKNQCSTSEVKSNDQGWSDSSGPPNLVPDSPPGLGPISSLAGRYYGRNATPLDAFKDAQRSKMSPDPIYSNVDLKDAEHYIFANNLASESAWNAVWLYPASLGYPVAKAAGFYPTASPPSLSEVYAGFAGTTDGLLGIKPSSNQCGGK